MINENDTNNITENKGDITITFGKNSPPHIGHFAQKEFGEDYARRNGMEFRVYTSKRHMKKLKTPRPYPETPLSPEQKAKHLPRILGVKQVYFAESPYSTIDELHAAGYSRVHVILGSDRMEDTAPGLIKRYGDRVVPVSFGEKRSEGKKGLAGASSTKMREHARANNFEAFKGMLPEHVPEDHARELFDDVRGGLKKAKVDLIESKNYKYSRKEPLFPTLTHALDHWGLVHIGDGKYRHFTGTGHVFDENELRFMQHYGVMQDPDVAGNYEPINKLQEEVSAQTRIKLSRIAKRNAKIRAAKRRARRKRRRTIPQLKGRAKQNVKNQLRHKMYKGSWKKLGFSTRANIDKNVNRRKKIADTMIRRILPSVIRGENERLRTVNTRRENVENIILPMLMEAVRGSRKSPTKKGANSVASRNSANRRKTRQRVRDKSKIAAGNVKGQFAVVRSKSGRFSGRDMVVAASSIDPTTMRVMVAPDKFTIAAGKNTTKQRSFINTDSSIKLYGMVGGAGKAKEKRAPKSDKPKQTRSTRSKTSKKEEVPSPQQKKAQKDFMSKEKLPEIDLNVDKNWKLPKSKKDRGFKASDYEFAFSTLAEMMVNGESPEKLIKNGHITRDQYLQLANNKNLVQATLRVLENSGFLGSEKGRYKFIHSGRGLGQENSKLYRDYGATDQTPKADVFILDTKDPKKSMGISFKSGAAQLGSSKEKETKAMATVAFEKSKDKLDKKCKDNISNLINEGFDQMANNLKLPGGIGVFSKNTGGIAERNPDIAKKVRQSIQANKKLEKTVSDIFNGCKEFKKAFLREAATGEGKFSGTHSKLIEEKYGIKVNAGIATHILAISDDATNATLVNMDDDFFEQLVPKTKMYIAAKTTNADTTAEIKIYEDTKAKMNEAAKNNDFKEFQNLVEQRVYDGYKRKGLKPPKFSKDELAEMFESIKESGNLPNILKFKRLQALAAVRLGVAGEKNKQVDENIIYGFMKKYISEDAVLSIVSDLDQHKSDDRFFLEKIMELEKNNDIEEVDPDEFINMCKEIAGDDPFKFLEMIGIELSGFSTNDINFDELFGQRYSSKVNTVYINDRPRYIPVIEESYLTEKRNYRKEYDNYHGKPEQRKNRAGRVKARRLMIKMGRARKGDGKDIDHKDGNPRNNGKNNLRVRSKSANRADND